MLRGLRVGEFASPEHALDGSRVQVLTLTECCHSRGVAEPGKEVPDAWYEEELAWQMFPQVVPELMGPAGVLFQHLLGMSGLRREAHLVRLWLGMDIRQIRRSSRSQAQSQLHQWVAGLFLS